MKSISRALRSAVVGVVVGLAAASAGATVLTTNISMDNGYDVYLSTSDTTLGTLFGSGNNWQTTFQDSTTLAAGTDYFLHVRGYDQGGIAGFLGEFSLSGTDHEFVNGLQTLLSNTTDWSGNNTGFDSVNTALIDLGADGVGPWGNRPNIADTAHWIWAGDAYNNDLAFFSTKISAVRGPASVPEPATLALLGLGLAGVALSRRRRQS